MEAKELYLLVMSALAVGALGCFTAAAALWWAQGGHLRLAERMEPHERSRAQAPPSSAPAADGD